MKLADLIAAIEPSAVLGPAAPESPVTGLHYRSDEVLPGGVFFAIPGLAVDGHAFIEDACRRGAAAVVAERPQSLDIALLQVDDSRAAMARAAAAFYDHPSGDLTLIGLSGTNGKTTVS